MVGRDRDRGERPDDTWPDLTDDGAAIPAAPGFEELFVKPARPGPGVEEDVFADASDDADPFGPTAPPPLRPGQEVFDFGPPPRPAPAGHDIQTARPAPVAPPERPRPPSESIEALVRPLFAETLAAEDDTRPSQRRPHPLLLAALALAVLGAVAFVAWPRLAPLLGGRTPAGNAEQGDAQPVISDPVPPPPVVVPEPAVEPTALPTAVPTAIPVPLEPASVVTGITWRRVPAGTEVRIDADGGVRPERVWRGRLDGPPRELLRIRGITRRLEPGLIAAGTAELVRIRVGLHGEASPPELHVVLDLASADLPPARLEAAGAGLTIVLPAR